MHGYEGYDGQTAPSTARHAVLNVTVTGAVAVGDTITQGTASAEVVLVSDTFLVITKSVNTFAAGNISVGGVVQGTCTGAQQIDGGTTAQLRASYKNLAADAYRADITAVPGSGDVLGVWYYDGEWYAFRDDEDGLTTKMYVESASGWTEVDLGYELIFTSGGTTEIEVGDTITGATSSATAVITKIIKSSGTWAGGDAAGRVFFAEQTGTFQAENLNIGASSNVATIAGDSVACGFPNPGGSFEFGNFNFTGNNGTEKMYGVDGANRGFEWDGTIFAPISTGMSQDMPTHLAEFKNHLFYSFYGGSAQSSGIGEPYSWTLLAGADEIGVGDDITGFMVQPGTSSVGALSIFSENSTSTLYGTSAADWNLVQYKNELGAIANTVQRIGRTYFLSNWGIIDLATSQDFGNFQDSVVSHKVREFLSTKMSQVTASCVVRSKNQYWLFFADKTALCCTVVNGKMIAMMPMKFEHKVTCVASCETSTGEEKVMFGSDDGYVRELFKGTSFDGAEIEWLIEFAEDHFESPLVDKRYRAGTLEVSGEGYADFFFSYSLGYSDATKAQPTSQQEIVELAPAYWDSFSWDFFSWDGISLTPTRFSMRGISQNMALILRGKSDYHHPLKFSGCIVQYTPLRMTR